MVEMPILYPKVVYSYETEESLPDAVLSLYSEVTNDAVRLSSMTVQHAESGLSWYVKPVNVIKDAKGRQYAGSSNLKMPEGENFPEGLYTIIFKDYAGNTKVSTFTLEKTSLDHMPERAVQNRRYIVMNNELNVLYVSSDTADTSDSVESLSSKYPDAASIREYISDVPKKAVYILPEEPARTADE